MNKSYRVQVCVKEYFDLTIQAADDQAIFNFKDPDSARWLYGASAHKLNHPELYRSYTKREIDLCSVEEEFDHD